MYLDTLHIGGFAASYAVLALFRDNADIVTLKKTIVPDGDPMLSAAQSRLPKGLYDRMRHFVGLDRVKAKLASFFNMVRLNALRAEHGMPQRIVNANMIFTGNPGTGKTTIARLLGVMFKEAGLLPFGHVVEMTPSDIGDKASVGSEIRTIRQKMQQAYGGILFIDEAHNFPEHAAKNSLFWKNALLELMREMTATAPRFVVIFAGYEDGMRDLFQMEPGLKSRFQTFIHFDDYSVAELVAIYKHHALNGQCVLAEGCESVLHKALTEASRYQGKTFGNARFVHNFFDDTLRCIADRLQHIPTPTRQDIATITAFDIKAASDKRREK